MGKYGRQVGQVSTSRLAERVSEVYRENIAPWNDFVLDRLIVNRRRSGASPKESIMGTPAAQLLREHFVRQLIYGRLSSERCRMVVL